MKILKNISILLLLFFINFIITNFFVHPLNQISIIALIIVWYLLLKSRDFNIYYILTIFFFIELFSGLPFGIGIITAMATLYILKWILTNILTNRSTSAILLSSIISVVIYRIIFFVLLNIYNFFVETVTVLNTGVLLNVAWETGITTVISLFIYIIMLVLARRINPKYILK